MQRRRPSTTRSRGGLCRPRPTPCVAHLGLQTPAGAPTCMQPPGARIATPRTATGDRCTAPQLSHACMPELPPHLHGLKGPVLHSHVQLSTNSIHPFRALKLQCCSHTTDNASHTERTEQLHGSRAQALLLCQTPFPLPGTPQTRFIVTHTLTCEMAPHGRVPERLAISKAMLVASNNNTTRVAQATRANSCCCPAPEYPSMRIDSEDGTSVLCSHAAERAAKTTVHANGYDILTNTGPHGAATA